MSPFLLLACLPEPSTTVTHPRTLPDFRWEAPVEATPTHGFGPRWLTQAAVPQDFHRGVDFPGQRGQPIHAAAGGTVHATRAATDTSSNRVVVEHEVDPFWFHGSEWTRAYTVYSHLDRIDVVEGEWLDAGQVLGTMGDSGGARSVHLHFEVRLGTPCSLEWQHQNPEAECATGFDPHVNPYVALQGSQPGGLEVFQTGTGLLVRLAVDDQDLARLTSPLGTVDFDHRTGMTLPVLDGAGSLDFGWVAVAPDPVRSGDTHRYYTLELDPSVDQVVLEDLHGHGVRWHRAD